VNFLYWNLYNKNLIESISNIVKYNDIDILILSEVDFSISDLIIKLNKTSANYFLPHPISQCSKIKIVTKFHYDFIKPIYENDRMTIRMLDLPLRIKTLLTCIHFIDKRNYKEESQYVQSTKTIRDIHRIEQKYNISSNIIVGDFNMNPFEKGMINADGFNATYSSIIANSEKKIIQK